MFSFLSDVENNNMNNFSLNEKIDSNKMSVDEFDKLLELKLKLYKFKDFFKEPEPEIEQNMETLEIEKLLSILSEKITVTNSSYETICKEYEKREVKYNEVKECIESLTRAFNKFSESYDLINSNYKNYLTESNDSESIYSKYNNDEEFKTISAESLKISKGDLDPFEKQDPINKKKDNHYLFIEKIYNDDYKKLSDLQQKLKNKLDEIYEEKQKLFVQLRSYNIMLSKHDPENDSECKICKERKIEIVFNCGHVCCSECSKNTLIKCFMCRGVITSRTNLYLN